MNFDSQLIRAITIYQLDNCGRIPLTGNVVLRDMKAGVKSVTTTRVIDQANPTSDRLVDGTACPAPQAIPIDNGIDVTLVGCGQNRVFESMLGFTTLLLTTGNITGYVAKRLTVGLKVAMEIIFEPYDDASCDGADEVTAMLIPMLSGWTLTNPQVHDGASRSDAGWMGRTQINKRLFDNFTGETTGTPEELAHWETFVPTVEAGAGWYVKTTMPAPTLAPGTGTPSVLSALVP